MEREGGSYDIEKVQRRKSEGWSGNKFESDKINC